MKEDDRELRVGELVEVRSAAEILATLGEDAALDAMPFMPEMLRLAGKQFEVSHRVEKICDTAGRTYRSRQMHSTVLLEDLRCDGSAHGGCQAGCRLYWKEAWLRRVSDQTPEFDSDDRQAHRLESLALTATTVTDSDDGEGVRYRCQATEAPAASEELGRFDPRQYLREVSSGNVRPLRVVWILTRAMWLKARQMLRHMGKRATARTEGASQSAPTAGFEPGDLVQVRSWEEIATTLDEQDKNRGLWFDDLDMVRYCGGTYRVRDRVQRIIDEGTGKMIALRSDCLILEDVCCSGERSPWRWCCPRGIFSFWREAWLRPVQHAGRHPDPISEVLLATDPARPSAPPAGR